MANAASGYRDEHNLFGKTSATDGIPGNVVIVDCLVGDDSFGTVTASWPAT